MQYPIVIEEPVESGDNFSAYAPDFDGVAATGATAEECARNMAGALALHIRGMVEDGEAIPEGRRMVRMVEPAAA